MRKKIGWLLWFVAVFSVAGAFESRAYADAPEGTLTGSCTVNLVIIGNETGDITLAADASTCVLTDADDFIALEGFVAISDDTEDYFFTVPLTICLGTSPLVGTPSACTASVTSATLSSDTAVVHTVEVGDFPEGFPPTVISYNFDSRMLCSLDRDGGCVLEEDMTPSSTPDGSALYAAWPDFGAPAGSMFDDGGALMDMAIDVSTFALTVVLPAVLGALVTFAIMQLVFRAIRRIVGVVG